MELNIFEIMQYAIMVVFQSFMERITLPEKPCCIIHAELLWRGPLVKTKNSDFSGIQWDMLYSNHFYLTASYEKSL